MKLFQVVALLLFSMNFAIADKQSELNIAVLELLEASNSENNFKQSIIELAKSMPLEHRASFKEMALNHVDIKKLLDANKQAMLRHLSLAEVKALTEFYKDPVIQSAIGKYPLVMAEFMPVLDFEVAKAQKAYKELKEKEFNDKYKIRK